MKNTTVERLIMEISIFYSEMFDDINEDEKHLLTFDIDSCQKIKTMSLMELQKLKGNVEKDIKYLREEIRCRNQLIAQTQTYNDLLITQKNLLKEESKFHQKAIKKNIFEKNVLSFLTIGAKMIQENKKNPLSKQAISYDIKSILTYGVLSLCLLNPITTVGVTLLFGYLGIRKLNRIYHVNGLNKIDNKINRLQVLYQHGEERMESFTKERMDFLTQRSWRESYLKMVNQEFDERTSKLEDQSTVSTIQKTNKVYQYHK